MDVDLTCTSGSDLSTEITVSTTRWSKNDIYGADRACLNTVDEPSTEQGLLTLLFQNTASLVGCIDASWGLERYYHHFAKNPQKFAL